MKLNKKIKICLSLYRIFSRAYFHLPFLVIYLFKLGFELITIEIIMGVYGLAVFVYTKLPIDMKPPAYLSCRCTLLLSEGLKCIGLFLIVITQSFAGICVAQLLLGVGYGISAGGDTRLINYHIDDGGKFQARSNSLMFASLLIAGLIGSVLFNIDIRLPFVASALADIFTGIVCVILPKEPGKIQISENSQKKVKLTIQEKNIVCIYSLTRGIILTFFTGFLPYHLFIDINIPIYGFIAILTGYTLLGNISSNFIATKMKHTYAVKVMNICLCASILMYFSDNLIMIILATVLLGLTSGATRPICLNELRNVGCDMTAILNLMESIYSVINLVLLVTGGILYQCYGFRGMLSLLLLIFILYIILNVYFMKRSSNNENRN